jgi:hypothetical protein
MIADGDPEPGGLDRFARVIVHRHRRFVILDDPDRRIVASINFASGASNPAATAIQSHRVERESLTP